MLLLVYRAAASISGSQGAKRPESTWAGSITSLTTGPLRPACVHAFDCNVHLS